MPRFSNVPRRTADGYRIAYQKPVLPDEFGEVEINGAPCRVTFQFVIELLDDAVRLCRVAHPVDSPFPVDANKRPIRPEVVLLSQSHDAFLASDAALRAASRGLFNDEVFAEARTILLKSREEGSFRRNLHIDNTRAQLDAILAQLRQGRRIAHGASSTEITYSYDAQTGQYRDHSVTTNPYTNARTVRDRALSEEGMREQLQALSYGELCRKLR